MTHSVKKNKATVRAMGGGDRGWRQQGRGLGQSFKKGVGNIVGLHKIGGLGPLCQLWFQIINFS